MTPSRLRQSCRLWLKRRFVEFFTANIRNRNTRESYLRAARFFCEWCDDCRFELLHVKPTIVAAYIEEIQQKYADGSVKAHLAAMRMLFDNLVTGGLLSFNPAQPVSGIARTFFPTVSAEVPAKTQRCLQRNNVRGLFLTEFGTRSHQLSVLLRWYRSLFRFSFRFLFDVTAFCPLPSTLAQNV